MTSVRHTFNTGDAIVADDFDDNFSDVLSAVDNIVNAQIASGAGITSDKIADRYTIDQPVIVLIPYGSDADYSDARDATNDFVTPTGATVMGRYKVTIASGQDAYLCGVNMYANWVDGSGGFYPTFSVYVNSVQIGGGYITIDNYGDPNGFFRLAKSNPISNPLLALADGDTIEFRMSGTGASAASGVWASPIIKREMVA